MPDAPPTPTEIELKLDVSPRDLPRLRRRLARFGAGLTEQVDNFYFDTTDRRLARHGLALRVRRIGRRWVQSLKTRDGATALSQRGEWEMPAPRGRLDVRRFADTPLAQVLGDSGAASLMPVFRTRFARTTWMARGRAIEIALDCGEIVAGAERRPILELELELKAGAAVALWEVALELAGHGNQGRESKGRRKEPGLGAMLALLPAGDSKAARGYRLSAGESPRVVKANAEAIVGPISSRTTAAEALRSVVERATTVLLANAAAMRERDDPELVHQARVALRRLRSAARLLRKPAAWPQALDGDLRWIGRVLGAVRDWDVLQQQTLPALVTAMPDYPQAQRLHELVRRRRLRDDRALSAALASARLARLSLRLLQWAQSPAPSSAAGIEAEARRRLSRLHRRLMATAVRFLELSLTQQHRVRIRAKRLRYALELFGAVLPRKRAARFGARLAQLQDELGSMNDAVAGAARLSGLAGVGRIGLDAALRWLAGEHEAHALRAAAVLAALAREPVPWR